MPKLMVMILLLSCVPIFCAECRLSTVDYVDTAVITNPDLSKPEDLLPVKTAFGCVYPEKGKLVVIQRFNGSDPISVLVIPAGAVVKVTGLVDDVETPEPKPQKLPAIPGPFKGPRDPGRDYV